MAAEAVATKGQRRHEGDSTSLYHTFWEALFGFSQKPEFGLASGALAVESGTQAAFRWARSPEPARVNIDRPDGEIR
jgi:hypothetical protein